MIYVFVWVLIGLIIIGYILCDKDFFTPTIVQLMGFAFSGIMCAYYMASMSYKIHADTISLMCACFSLSTFIGCLVHLFFKRIKIKPLNYEKQQMPSISLGVHGLVLLFQAGTILWQFYEIRRIGGMAGSFSQIMATFRARNSYGLDVESQLPFLLRQLMPVMYAIAANYLLYIIKNYSGMSRASKVISIMIVLIYCASSLITGARGGVINLFLAAVLMYHMVRIQKGHRFKKYKISFILRISAIIMLVCWFFSFARSIVGRQSQAGLLNYISGYAGTSILNFDLYLQRTPVTSDIWGKWTFYRLLNNLRMLGIINIAPYLVHYEFARVNGISTGNTYTLFRDYHNDFGMIGLFVLHGIASLLVSILYEYCKRKPNNKMIILNGYLYNALVLSFYTERFYDLTFSFSFIRNAVILMIVYTLLFKRTFHLFKSVKYYKHGKAQ